VGVALSSTSCHSSSRVGSSSSTTSEVGGTVTAEVGVIVGKEVGEDEGKEERGGTVSAVLSSTTIPQHGSAASL